MKKTYTKKQIQEAIAYWESQLRRMSGDIYGFDFNGRFSSDEQELRKNVKEDLDMNLDEFLCKLVEAICSFVVEKYRRDSNGYGDAFDDAECDLQNPGNLYYLEDMIRSCCEDYDENRKATLTDILSDENAETISEYVFRYIESYVEAHPQDYKEDSFDHAHEDDPRDDGGHDAYYGIDY